MVGGPRVFDFLWGRREVRAPSLPCELRLAILRGELKLTGRGAGNSNRNPTGLPDDDSSSRTEKYGDTFLRWQAVSVSRV